MRNKILIAKFALAAVSAHLLVPAPLLCQDLVPVNDITGGSSVFVFKRGSTLKKKVPPTSSKRIRSKEQRVESFVAARKQVEANERAKPRRPKILAVQPDKIPVNVKSMSAKDASKLFAGVGEYYLDRDDADKAAEFYRESINLDASNVAARPGLSEAIARQGGHFFETDQPEKAKAFYLESLKYNERNAAALMGLGQLFAENGDAQQAIANFEKALAEDAKLTDIYLPLGILYFQGGEIAKADALISKAVMTNPDDAETQLFVGSIRFAQGRDAEALAAFQRVKQIDSRLPEGWFNSGEVLMRMDRTQDAAADFEKAVSLKPDYFEAWRSLGDAYVGLKNYPEAVRAFKQAVRLKNNNVEAYIGLADAQRINGSFGDAIGNYNLAITFMERSPEYTSGEKADLYSKKAFVTGRQCATSGTACDWAAVIRDLEKASQLGGGGDSADLANLGWAYYNSARSDMYFRRTADAKAKQMLARTNLEKAVAARPSFVDGPQLNLGMVCTDLGDYKCTIDNLSEVVKRKPEWALAWNELGIAHRKQDKYKEAIGEFKKAIAAEPKFAEAYFNLGESALKANEMKDAKYAYQNLVKLGRKDYAGQLELMSRGAVRQ